STKSVSEIYAPENGAVSLVYTDLAKQPELLNKDPYGAGWICEITIDGSTPSLLDAAAYRAIVGA
ncbi:MAG: glycine cleavage system protein H, partial [Actinomycetota bacterium]